MTEEFKRGAEAMQQAVIDLLNEHDAPLHLVARVVEMDYPEQHITTDAQDHDVNVFRQAVEATKACIIRRLNLMGGRNAATFVESLQDYELPTLLKL